MASKQLSISIPSEMLSFLDDNPSISPSKVFQSSIENIQNSIKHNPQLIEALKECDSWKKSYKKLQDEFQKYAEEHK